MSNSYQSFLSDLRGEVKIVLSHSTETWNKIRAEYSAATGTDDMYQNYELFKLIQSKYSDTWEYKNISLRKAQEIAEPIRIANPEQCVSIYTSDNSFIGNTSWADQMKYFFEYETFTAQGAELTKQRQAEAKELGIQASWE